MALLIALLHRGNALIAIGVIAALAYQWTNSLRLAANRLESIEARELDVEARSAMPIEQLKRVNRACVPIAVGVSSKTAHATQLYFKLFGNVCCYLSPGAAAKRPISRPPRRDARFWEIA
jgi:hypothetical protein